MSQGKRTSTASTSAILIQDSSCGSSSGSASASPQPSPKKRGRHTDQPISANASSPRSNNEPSKSLKSVIVVDSDDDDVRVSSKYDDVVDIACPDSNSTPRFLHGCIRTTPIPGFSDPDNSVHLSQLIAPDGLQKAIISTFVLDFNWLLSMLPPSTRLCLIRHWDPGTGDRPGVFQITENIVAVHPSVARYGSIHAKFAVLFYPTYVRVIVSSANYIPYDWEAIQNVVYVQDFSYRNGPNQAASRSSDPDPKQFGLTLIAMLEAMGAPKSVVESISTIDFSTATGYLVASVPRASDPYLQVSESQHTADSEHEPISTHELQFGLNRLRQLSRNMYPPDYTPSKIQYISSSLGYNEPDFIFTMIDALCPRPPPYDGSQGSPPKHRWPSPEALQIGFPTYRQVVESRLGLAGGGTIFLNRVAYLRDAFPKKSLYKYQSKQMGILSHAKVAVVSGGYGKYKDKAWVYIGSHNFSKAAWGTTKPKIDCTAWYRRGICQHAQDCSTDTLRKKGSGATLTIKSYELGIMVPCQFVGEQGDACFYIADHNSSSENLVHPEHFFSLPFRLDWTPYQPGEKPWINDIQ